MTPARLSDMDERARMNVLRIAAGYIERAPSRSRSDVHAVDSLIRSATAEAGYVGVEALLVAEAAIADFERVDAELSIVERLDVAIAYLYDGLSGDTIEIAGGDTVHYFGLSYESGKTLCGRAVEGLSAVYREDDAISDCIGCLSAHMYIGEYARAWIGLERAAEDVIEGLGADVAEDVIEWVESGLSEVE